MDFLQITNLLNICLGHQILLYFRLSKDVLAMYCIRYFLHLKRQGIIYVSAAMA